MLKSDAINIPSVNQFGYKLQSDLQTSENSFENVAQQVAERIYKEVTQPDGEPMFGLVRVFRICSTDDLYVGLLDGVEDSSTYWLALMGTYGDEPAWQGRTLSRRYKVMAVTGISNPVMKAALDDLQLHPDQTHIGQDEDTVKRDGIEANTFYIKDAATSPHMAQEASMISNYGIQSVIGLGNEFRAGNGEGYIIVMFSRVPIDEEMHTSLAYLGVYLNELFEAYESGKKPLWDGY